MKTLTFLSIAVACVLVGCSTKAKISGDVFTLDKDSHVVKMPVVHVTIVNTAEFKKHAQSVRAKVAQGLSDVEKAEDVCVNGVPVSSEPGAAIFRDPTIDKDCYATTDARSYDILDPLFDAPAVAVATTNSDGKFEVTVPDAKGLTVLARGTRTENGKTYHFSWIVPVSSPEEPLSLTNTNSVIPYGIKGLLASF